MHRTLALCTMLALTAAPAAAQRRADRVPPGHRPPAGSCRVWVDGVPPGRQPAPTDCATAERTRPANGAVIYGDQTWDRGGYDGEARGKRKGRRDKGKYVNPRGDRDDRRARDDRYDRADRDGRYDSDDRRCADRNRDGWCDDRDGRRDPYPRPGYPAERRRTLPEMIGVGADGAGRRTAEQERWLGRRDVRGRTSDRDRDGRPERIVWLDRTGRTVQAWHDDDRDGRADRVALYRDGRVERVVRR